MPDDFGHDPELPVILSSMGLQAVGFARVPGAFPTYASRIHGEASMACSLMASGVAFYWLAGDGSQVFAHFMPDTYGVPFYSQGTDGTGNASKWSDFVNSSFISSSYLVPGSSKPSCVGLTSATWPGGIAFAPAGGDFAVPDIGWVSGVDDFNLNKNGVTASIGRFTDYVAAVIDSGADLLKTQLDPSNFFTGYFASRPELKILQARAAGDLVAAETISSLLWLGSNISSAALNALDDNIPQIWNVLAPSSHHDFVTGTSPDRVYKMEQYPMLSLASELACGVHAQALRMIANSIIPTGTGAVVAVHNAVGVSRAGIFRLERGTGVRFDDAATVQVLPDGALLVQAPSVPSLGYLSGQVIGGAAPAARPPAKVNGSITLDNGVIAITLSQSGMWGITSIIPAGGANVLPPSGVANLLQLYDDTGNLYQFGNEPQTDGAFTPNAGGLTAGNATQTEFGPLRYSVEAVVNGPNDIGYRIVYSLIAGESMVRIAVTGSAPANTTVVTRFPALATDGSTAATHLVYGTPHHFHADSAPAYWKGPTFKATHLFLMPAADNGSATFALAAIYHNGMPAWACYREQLIGSLFRNANGTKRGAAGSDTDVHTQHFALRISMTPLDPTDGTPLVEALQYANPLHAAIADRSDKAEQPIILPASQSLASTPAPALIRVARPMGNVRSASGQPIQGQIALRIYRPNADGTAATVQVTMPVITTTSDASPTLVTALEEPIPAAPAIIVNDTGISVPAPFAVTTFTIAATRPVTTATNVK